MARQRLRRFTLVAVVLALSSIAGCSSGRGDPPDSRASVSPVPDAQSDEVPADAAMWMSFEESARTAVGGTEFPDALGGAFGALVVAANGGTVDVVPGVDGTGDAVAFPPRCTGSTECPRAMLEVSPHPALDVGLSDFSFGAAVWLAPDQATTGSNIVQKGRFSADGGQWKLQVDSESGEPSCVVRGREEQPLVVRSTVSIADSTWHRVECRRDRTGITILVDGTEDRRDGPTGSVDNDWPVRIGSPGLAEDDDQFHGLLDDVFLRVAPPT